MSETPKITEPAELRKLFQNGSNAHRPYIYIPITSENGLDAPEKLRHLVQGYKKSGWGGIIPFSYGKSPVPALTDAYYAIYDILCRAAEEEDMKVGYIDDSYIMRAYLANNPDAGARCQILEQYELACGAGEHIHKALPENRGKLMSIMAVDDDTQEMIDIRPYLIREGEKTCIDWTVPGGNWNIEEYFCAEDPTSPFINILEYDISYAYLKETFRKWLDDRKEHFLAHMGPFIYRNIAYAGRNRRMWSPSFNEVFEERYGFDPAPYYPLLFRDFGRYSKRYKSMLMVCRAHMLVEGYMKAASDICHSKGVFCTGFPAESKATACSWMFGDGQMLHKYASAPGISIPFAYLYGLNGIKVAAGAADAFGREAVSADIFKYYETLNKDIIYRETYNSLVRGVNMLFAHLGEDRTDTASTFGEEKPVWGSIFSKNDDLAEYASFVTRAQTLLRGGQHVCDAAVLYPIHSLHAFVFLYQTTTQQGFEYPMTPENADYMEIMNSFLNYVGIDAAFLHPNILRDRGVPENGTLYIKPDGQDASSHKYRLLILPSMSLISLKTLRIVKKFFDEGGKIIATDSLPTGSYECSIGEMEMNAALKTESEEDREVRRVIRAIFGEDCQDTRTYKRYYKNTNENGGQAYFFPSNMRSVDGTDAVSASMLYQAMEHFGFAPDVYIDKMPRIEFSGILNYHLPAFRKVDIAPRLAKGCSMNYIHKRYAGADVYFFTNTTGEDYQNSILLRGRHQPEEWNPFTGKIRKLTGEPIRFRGEIYTKIQVTIPASSCTFIVDTMQRNAKEIIRDVEEEEKLPVFQPSREY